MSGIDTEPARLETGTIAGFAIVPLPPRLWVPLATRPASIDPAHLRMGCVKCGDALAEGGLPSGFTPVAPVNGEFASVAEVELSNGQRAPAAELVVNANQSLPAPAGPMDSFTTASEFLDQVSKGGIWAQRQTSPNLILQMTTAIKRPIDLVVCNLLEADGAPLNAALVRSSAPAIMLGAAAIAMALGANAQFVVDEECYQPVADAVRDRRRCRVIELPNDYPQADPTILLYMLTGRRLRPGRLPVEQGVLVLDGFAALALGQYLASSIPMIHVPLVIRERGCGRVHLVSAAVGTPLRFVLQHLGVATSDVIIRAGAVLRDNRLGADAVVGGGEIRFDVSPTPAPTIADPCIRCGWCVAACPTRIHPAGLLEAAQRSDANLAETFGIHACIECGICSYVCPSRLPLLQSIRGMMNDFKL